MGLEASAFLRVTVLVTLCDLNLPEAVKMQAGNVNYFPLWLCTETLQLISHPCNIHRCVSKRGLWQVGCEDFLDLAEWVVHIPPLTWANPIEKSGWLLSCRQVSLFTVTLNKSLYSVGGAN